MADGINTVWIDSTFIPAEDALDGTIDTHLEFVPAAAENIGSRSMPVIYRAYPLAADDIEYINVVVGVPSTVVSGLLNVAEEYYRYPAPKVSGVLDSLVQYSYNQEYAVTKDYPHIYRTGFNAISGSQNLSLAFIAGHEIPWVFDISHVFSSAAPVSGSLNYDVNYSNFSGNTNVSGEPIPFYYKEINRIAEYTAAVPTLTSGGVHTIIDISFAGWIYHYFGFDVFSVDLGFNEGFNYEVTLSGGGVDVHYLDVFSTTLTTSGISMDLYCALTDMATIDFEVETIKGRIVRNYYEVYSCAQTHGAVNLDIELFPIKITNFSLDEGEHTDADGFISVDVLDDTCPVSISGTYFKVDGVRVPVTLSGITDGYRMYYDPDDNFSSLEGPTTFTAHAENECGQSLEQDYYLTFGYIVEYDNHPSSWQGIDYGFDKEVVVRVTAENYASCPQVSSLAWDFESKELFNKDLGASIVGRFFSYDHGDLSAEIRSQNLAYFYGKEFEVVLTLKDFAGNEMEPLILNYRIEDKPEN